MRIWRYVAVHLYLLLLVQSVHVIGSGEVIFSNSIMYFNTSKHGRRLDMVKFPSRRDLIFCARTWRSNMYWV